MAAPVNVPGAYGNLISGVTVKHGAQTIAAILAVGTDIDAQVTCEIVTGPSPPTVLTTFSAYKVVGISTTLSASSASGATTLTIAGTPATYGFKAGQHILVQQAAGSKLGELCTITSVSGSVMTVPAILNAYTSGDTIVVVATTASFPITPSSAAGTYVASSLYSETIFLPSATWAIAAQNPDATNDDTATVTYDLITSFV